MAERLGNVLYWTALAVAIPLLLTGALMSYHHYLHGPVYSDESIIVAWVAAFLVWLLGRACRYVLAGR